MKLAWKLGATLTGMLTLVTASLGIAEDKPILRTLDGREPVAVNDAATQALRAATRDDVAVTTKATTTKPNAVTADVKNAQNEPSVVDSPTQLPVSDITLPSPTKMSASKKQSIAQKIEGILNEKAMRNTVVGIEVRDLDEGSIVYAKNNEKLLKPASNNKLLTTAAALHILGGDHQFETRVNAEGKIENGVLKGNLHVYIDHDFTWSTRFYPTNGTPWRGLLAQIQSAGIKKITGKVIVSGYVVYGGKTTAMLHAPSHLRLAAQQFGGLLKQHKLSYGGISVEQNNDKMTGKTIATWKSPMLSEAIVPLNRSSHNEYADMLMLAMGAHHSGKNTYEAGWAAVNAWLKSEGLATKGVIQRDGSGLSHENHITAHFFNDLTQYMLHTKYAREWSASMSISGYDGTYGGRLTTEDGLGRVYAKSGTLRDVISGTGFFVNATNGHTYAFSIMVNAMRQKKNTRAAIDRIVRQFLGDNDGEVRPAIPMMQSLRKESSGRVVARWDQIAGVQGYRVYTSTDDGTWVKRAETKDTVLIMPDEPVQMRVTAVTASGAESHASLAFSYRPGAQTWSILDVARCRSDSPMRPTNHLFTHERSLAGVIPAEFGVETVRDANLVNEATKGILWHDVSCTNRLVSTDEAIQAAAQKPVPFVLNVVDAPNVQNRPTTCDPTNGQYLGCYAGSVISMDRRIGKRSENTRQRKAAGSLSSKPTATKVWTGAQSCLDMADNTVATCAGKDAKRVVVIGVDLEGLDSAKTQAVVSKIL